MEQLIIARSTYLHSTQYRLALLETVPSSSDELLIAISAGDRTQNCWLRSRADGNGLTTSIFVGQKMLQFTVKVLNFQNFCRNNNCLVISKNGWTNLALLSRLLCSPTGQPLGQWRCARGIRKRSAAYRTISSIQD